MEKAGGVSAAHPPEAEVNHLILVRMLDKPLRFRMHGLVKAFDTVLELIFSPLFLTPEQKIVVTSAETVAIMLVTAGDRAANAGEYISMLI